VSQNHSSISISCEEKTMRPLCLTALIAFGTVTMTPLPSFAQEGVSDFDWDCLSNPIRTSEMLQGCSLMLVEIADLENAGSDIVNERIRKTVGNADTGGGAKIRQDACTKSPLASYRGGNGASGQLYAALCTSF